MGVRVEWGLEFNWEWGWGVGGVWVAHPHLDGTGSSVKFGIEIIDF